MSLAFAIASAPPAQAHRAHVPCGKRHAIVSNPKVEIFKGTNTLGQPEFFGCRYGSRRGPYALGPVPEFTSSGGGGVEGLPVLAGTITAYQLYGTNSVSASWLIVVRDLSTGQVLHRVPTGISRSPEDIGAGFATAIVAKSDGAVAWIAPTNNQPREYEVHTADKLGNRVVATGTIEPDSLAIAGSTLYWTQDGKASSTTLQ